MRTENMIRKTRGDYTPEFKAKVAIEALKEEKTMAELSSEYGVNVNSIISWKKEFLENSALIFDRKNSEKRKEEELKAKDKQIDELYKEVGQLTIKVNWAKKKVRELGLDD
jgi:transposase